LKVSFYKFAVPLPPLATAFFSGEVKGDGGAAVPKKSVKRDLCIPKKDHQKKPQTRSSCHDTKGDGGAAVQKKESKETYIYQKMTTKKTNRQDLLL